MKLSTRLTTTMAMLVILCGVLVGYFGDRAARHELISSELDRLDRHTQVLASDFTSYVRSAHDDVLAMRRSSNMIELVESLRQGGDAPPDPRLLDRLARDLQAELSVKQAYDQFRFVGNDNDGCEIVRVDRSGPEGAERIVSESELQVKGDRVYFRNAIALADGEVYVSPIELNIEHGLIQVPHVPVMRFATPVYAAGGEGAAVGIVVIDLDMSPALDRIDAALPADWRIYLVDENADYLFHSGGDLVAGFQPKGELRLEQEFPDLTDFSLAGGPRLLSARESGAFGVATARIQYCTHSHINLVATVPYTSIIAPQRSVRRSAAIAGLGCVAIAILLAMLLSRSLARPLERLTEAVDGFARDGIVRPPIAAGGEVGVLSNAFHTMAHDVDEKASALAREVKERRRAEMDAESYAEKMKYFAKLVESSQDAIVATTLDGTITSWNPAAENLYGFDGEEAIGRNIGVIIPESRKDEDKAILARIRNREQVENLETVRVCKLGMHVDVSLTVSPIFSGTGEIIGVSNISHDITRRKLAEEKLRLAVEACPGGIIMVDGEGVITLVNAEAERLFGYSRTELIGRPVEILVPGAARGAHVDFRRQYGANPQRRMMGAGRNLHGVRKDGSEFPIEIGLNPIKIRGEVMVLSVVIDITERRRFEEAAAEINRDLQRSNDELRQFAYVASHDLQEPLRMVASYTELLAERYVGQLDTAADKYIQYAVEGARRMQHLVGDLLAYSRVGTEGKPFVPTDTRQVLKTVLENLQRTILETGAQIVFDEMPTIKADATQLCQLFQNLISNAVKFRADRPPHVRIEARKAGDEWEFTVQDNGIGIGEAYRGRIFQMFQRLHDRSTYDGNGIGLALAKKIVERHGGRIWCTSKPGEGTTFHFTMSERSGFG